MVDAVSPSSVVSAAFMDALSPTLRDRYRALPGLTERLESMVAAAEDSAEGFTVPVDRFAAYLGARIDPDVEPDEMLDHLRVDDLYLACACGLGQSVALAVFDRRFGGDLDLAATRGGRAVSSRDEFRQRVREKLFVGTAGHQPRIDAYNGRGALRSWVRVTSVRMVLDLARQREDPADSGSGGDVFDAMPQAGPDPELDYIRRIHGAQLPDAMKEAFEGLTARQRNLLRQRYLHGLSTDHLAKLYNVHRATAFRWVEGARRLLFERTRDLMMARLKLSGNELDSLMGDLQSRLHVSVRRIFETGLENES